MSTHGIGVVIDIPSGHIIDFHVMATFCQLCASVGKQKRRDEEDVFKEWYASHKHTCSINHNGSPGMMEEVASKIMWGRSLSNGLRYTTLVSDRDSKTFLKLTKMDPYNGVPIVKEECTNHVAKRLGTGLRNLVSAESKKGNTLGGRHLGALTQVKIGHLQGAVTSRWKVCLIFVSCSCYVRSTCISMPDI